MTNHPNRSKHQRGAPCIYRDMTARELAHAIDTQAELLAALKLALPYIERVVEPPTEMYPRQRQRQACTDVVIARIAIAKAEGR